MDMTILFLDVDMIIKTHEMLLWQKVSDPQLQSHPSEQFIMFENFIILWKKGECALFYKKPNYMDDKNRCKLDGNMLKLSHAWKLWRQMMKRQT